METETFCRWCCEPEDWGNRHVLCGAVLAATDQHHTIDEAAEALEALNLEILTDRRDRLRGSA